jgi:two-component system LytT family response regulator
LLKKDPVLSELNRPGILRVLSQELYFQVHGYISRETIGQQNISPFVQPPFFKRQNDTRHWQKKTASLQSAGCFLMTGSRGGSGFDTKKMQPTNLNFDIRMTPAEISVVLVDDEQDSIEILEHLLKGKFPGIHISGKARSLEEAYTVINACKPDLVFLDIQLKSMTAFDLLGMEFTRPFEIIFITAYSEFALRAFKHHAVSYLLKPIDENELFRATQRAINILRLPSHDGTETQLPSHKVLGDRIAISTGSEVEYLAPPTIMYAMAEGSYCRIFLNDGSTRMISRNLKYLETKLDEEVFFRPHRSYLVNSWHIKKWNKAEGGLLVLSDGSTIPMSKEGRDYLGRHS